MTDIQYPVVLKVDYALRKRARATGAQWNRQKRQWEARTPAALFKCRRWTHQRLGVLWKREWLDVPYNTEKVPKCSMLSSILSSDVGTILFVVLLSPQRP
eukprot:16255-Heterococcus_DN1.PRE.1